MTAATRSDPRGNAGIAASLWQALTDGRPKGKSVYHRPRPLSGPRISLPWTGLDLLDDPHGASPMERLACWLTTVCGITRFEPHDMLGPHHVTPTMRGVRVVTATVTDASGWRGAYDPTTHQLVGLSHQEAPPSSIAEPVRLHLDANLARVPEGYGPVRHLVGLLEAGMHLTAAVLATQALGASADMRQPALRSAKDPWSKALLDVTWPGNGSSSVASTPAPSPALPDGCTLADVCRARSAGHGPWGTAPAAASAAQREAAAAAISRAKHRVSTTGAPAGLHVIDVDCGELARFFTYRPDVVDVAGACAAAVWTCRRSDREADAEAAVLACGAQFMALALEASAAGLTARPARSIDATALHARLGLRADEVIVATAILAVDSYQELSMLPA